MQQELQQMLDLLIKQIVFLTIKLKSPITIPIKEGLMTNIRSFLFKQIALHGKHHFRKEVTTTMPFELFI